jgi:ABC-type sugar transport system substrate-binding protein
MHQKIHSRRQFGGSIALAAAILLLAGCASTGASESTSPTSSTGTTGGLAAAQEVYDELASNPPLEIEPLPGPVEEGISVAYVNCTIPACLPRGGEEPAEALGWSFDEFSYDLGKGPSDVVQAVESAIASKPDILIVSQSFGAALIQEQIDAAIESGMKVIAVGYNEDVPDYVACIQCTPALEAMGAAGGNVALADAGESTSIGVMIDKNYSFAVQMADGTQSAVAENGDGSTTQMVELSLADNPAANAARTVSFLQRNPDVEYLVTTTPAFLAGTSSALEAAGLDVKIIGLNPSNDGDVALIETGDVHLWVAGESGEKAFVWRAFDAAARAVMDAPIEPKEPITLMRLITPEDPDPSLQAPADFKEIYKTAWDVN